MAPVAVIVPVCQQEVDIRLLADDKVRKGSPIEKTRRRRSGETVHNTGAGTN